MPRKSAAALKRDRAQEKAAETKRRSDRNPRGSKGPEKLAKMFPIGEQPKSRKPAARNKRAEAPRTAAAARRWDPASTDWGSPEFGAEATRIAQDGKTMKEVTAEMGLPAETKYWRYVSLAVRAWKDSHGIARPGRRSATPTAAPSMNGGPKKTKSTNRKVSLKEMTDEEVTAAIEGRTVTYNYSATPGTDTVFVAKVGKYHPGRGGERVVTFWDHVTTPSLAEVERARKENREPNERADGNIRSLYVSQIISIGRKG
jgi:hypothetical protein